MNEDGTSDSEEKPRRDHLAVTGRVDARPYLVGRVLKADWLCRTLYNAARDRHVPFAEGFAYRHALSEARHHNLKLPDEPTKSDRFLPVPKMQDLQPILVHLRARYSDLSEFAYSTQWEAIDDAIKAVAKHVAACVEAKAAGAKLPGGRVAARRARRAEADAKADALHERRVAAGRKSGAMKKAAAELARGLSRGVDRACGPGPHETRGGTSGGTAMVQAHAVPD